MNDMHTLINVIRQLYDVYDSEVSNHSAEANQYALSLIGDILDMLHEAEECAYWDCEERMMRAAPKRSNEESKEVQS